MQKIQTKKLVKRLLLTALISSLLPLSLFISIPFELFAANYNEFVFTFSDFFPVCIGFFFLFYFGVFALMFFLPKRVYRIVSAIVIAISLMFFIQGNYLNGEMGSLNGDGIGGGVKLSTEIVNIIIWIVVVAVAVVLACLKDKKNIFGYIGIVMSFIVLTTQLIAPISISISQSEIFMSSEERMKLLDETGEHNITTFEGLNTVSSESNIFYFCIDRFDETFAEKAYDLNPEIYSELTGFTWFQDHVSLYGRTYPAVANMLTNQEHDSDFSRAKYLNEAYQNQQTLDILNENGYNIHLYTIQYYSFLDAYYLPDYVANRSQTSNYEISDKVGLSMSLVELSLYRNLPYFMKELFWVDSTTSNSFVKEKDAAGQERYEYDTKLVSQYLDTHEMQVSEEQKGFHFIHTVGCHAASDATNGARLTEENFEIINKYIKFLKQEGLYENSTIIITGDHGFSPNSWSGLSDSMLTALFVKPSGESQGELKTSQAQTSHKNLWATIFNSENIETDADFGPSVFEVENQERTFVWHTWATKLITYTYKIVGSAKEFEHWDLVDEKHYDKTLVD